MMEEYERSMLPYPFKAIWKLDYCWNIVNSHILNSLFFAVPMTVVFSYAMNPKVRNDGMKSRPFVYYVSVYVLVYSMMVTYFMVDSLVFCDYCKPWSSVYKSNSKTEDYKNILKNRIKKENWINYR